MFGGVLRFDDLKAEATLPNHHGRSQKISEVWLVPGELQSFVEANDAYSDDAGSMADVVVPCWSTGRRG